MNTKHSEGQWLARRKYESSNRQEAWAPYISDGDSERVLCYMNLSGAYNGYAGNERAMADARIMAAAPELLEAIQIWMRFFDEMPKGQFAKISCDIGLMNDGFIKSKRAIAKATG